MYVQHPYKFSLSSLKKYHILYQNRFNFDPIMSGARRDNNQQQSSWLKTAATFAVGAAVGAAAAGIAYFAATEDDRMEQQQRQQHANMQAPRARVSRSGSTDSLEEEKVLGVVKVCEICFEDFEQLKDREIHIMATPCGHVFCRVCIEEALTRQPRCPHCRQNVEIQQLQRLYL